VEAPELDQVQRHRHVGEEVATRVRLVCADAADLRGKFLQFVPVYNLQVRPERRLVSRRGRDGSHPIEKALISGITGQAARCACVCSGIPIGVWASRGS